MPSTTTGSVEGSTEKIEDNTPAGSVTFKKAARSLKGRSTSVVQETLSELGVFHI